MIIKGLMGTIAPGLARKPLQGQMRIFAAPPNIAAYIGVFGPEPRISPLEAPHFAAIRWQHHAPPNRSPLLEKKKRWFARNPNRKTRAESHAIDATRHLYASQYPVWNLSRLQMIHGSSNLALLCALRRRVWSWPEGYRNFNR